MNEQKSDVMIETVIPLRQKARVTFYVGAILGILSPFTIMTMIVFATGNGFLTGTASLNVILMLCYTILLLYFVSIAVSSVIEVAEAHQTLRISASSISICCSWYEITHKSHNISHIGTTKLSGSHTGPVLLFKENATIIWHRPAYGIIRLSTNTILLSPFGDPWSNDQLGSSLRHHFPWLYPQHP